MNAFGRLMPAPSRQTAPFAEVLGVLGEAVKAGKIRRRPLTRPPGADALAGRCEQGAGPRMVSIRTAYLMNRMFEVGLAEVAIREQIRLWRSRRWRWARSPANIWRRPAGRRAHDGVPNFRATWPRAPRRRPRPMSAWPASTGWTRRRWPSPDQRAGLRTANIIAPPPSSS